MTGGDTVGCKMCQRSRSSSMNRWMACFGEPLDRGKIYHGISRNMLLLMTIENELKQSCNHIWPTVFSSLLKFN